MFAPFPESKIDLLTDRVSVEDARRQQRSAKEILRRLERQPGVILADEVGMGKTFVAMAVAASIILHRPTAGPVVVMVPSSLKEKWPKDWNVFNQKCIAVDGQANLRYAEANSGLAFLKLLDDPPERKAQIIFLTHGALYRSLTDGYAKLAVIKRAFKGRSSLAEQRRNFHKFAGRLLRMKSVDARAPRLLRDLLERPYEGWMRAIHRANPAFKQEIFDDPVPQHLQEALEDIEREMLEPLVEELRKLPVRSSASDERLDRTRRALAYVMNDIWDLALRKSRFESPLLILDEAHHLKNPATRLASLFVNEDTAKENAENKSDYFVAEGALGGKFERMLFLTATPFQLGHAELINVLKRFDGINWKGAHCSVQDRKDFNDEITALAGALDDAQAAALRLDKAWGHLTAEQLFDEDGNALEVDDWWHRIQSSSGEGITRQVVEQVRATSAAMQTAQQHLYPWVLRHLKPKWLPARSLDGSQSERRIILPGAAIIREQVADIGLEIEGDSLFPFLLAGRAQAMMAATVRGRALFAEGLASSFEAYFETRSDSTTVEEDPDFNPSETPQEIDWYLAQLDRALPRDSRACFESHPKIRATVERAVELWKAGEKVLIFCHYRATGNALRHHISARLNEEIIKLGHQKLPHLKLEEVSEELEHIGGRFFDSDGSLRNEVTEWIERIVLPFVALESNQKQRIVEVVRRFLRTPSFLARYFDLDLADHAKAFVGAIERQDVGGLSLKQRIDDFCSFLANRCIVTEREQYLDALARIQTGSHTGREAIDTFDSSERAEDAHRAMPLPNVRLANGRVKDETRRRLLLAFNTPLFPEILIASSVLAEGVDLHLNCRYVIHHDLCWNPSMLEQRTGRVDRLGSKAEQVGKPIHVYLPYVAATQDEKMYRVVRDRERWFQIIMGDRYEVDEASSDRRAERIPLPQAIQNDLALKLEVLED